MLLQRVLGLQPHLFAATTLQTAPCRPRAACISPCASTNTTHAESTQPVSAAAHSKAAAAAARRKRPASAKKAKTIPTTPSEYAEAASSTSETKSTSAVITPQQATQVSSAPMQHQNTDATDPRKVLSAAAALAAGITAQTPPQPPASRAGLKSRTARAGAAATTAAPSSPWAPPLKPSAAAAAAAPPPPPSSSSLPVLASELPVAAAAMSPASMQQATAHTAHPPASSHVPPVAISQPGCVGHGLHWAVLQWLLEDHLHMPPGALADVNDMPALLAVIGQAPRVRPRGRSKVAAWEAAARAVMHPEMAQQVKYTIKRQAGMSVVTSKTVLASKRKPYFLLQAVLGRIWGSCKGNLTAIQATSLSLQASLDAAPTPARARLREHVAACMQLCTHHSPMPQVALRLLLHAMAAAVPVAQVDIEARGIQDQTVGWIHEGAKMRHEFSPGAIAFLARVSLMTKGWKKTGSELDPYTLPYTNNVFQAWEEMKLWHMPLKGAPRLEASMPDGLLGPVHGIPLPRNAKSVAMQSRPGTVKNKATKRPARTRHAEWRSQMLLAHPELLAAPTLIAHALKQSAGAALLGHYSAALHLLDLNAWPGVGGGGSGAPGFSMHRPGLTRERVKEVQQLLLAGVQAGKRCKLKASDTLEAANQVLLACPSIYSDDNITFMTITQPRMRALATLLSSQAPHLDALTRGALLAQPDVLNRLLYCDGGRGPYGAWLDAARDGLQLAVEGMGVSISGTGVTHGTTETRGSDEMARQTVAPEHKSCP